MSDSTGLVVIGALLIPASFSMYYIVNSMNDKTLQITTGSIAETNALSSSDPHAT